MLRCQLADTLACTATTHYHPLLAPCPAPPPPPLAGVVLGPLVQWICYTWLVSRMDWEAEAVKAHRHMLEVAESTSGAGI